MVNVIFTVSFELCSSFEKQYSLKKGRYKTRKKIQNDQLIMNKKWITHLSPVQYPSIYRDLSQLCHVFGLTVVYKS